MHQNLNICEKKTLFFKHAVIYIIFQTIARPRRRPGRLQGFFGRIKILLLEGPLRKLGGQVRPPPHLHQLLLQLARRTILQFPVRAAVARAHARRELFRRAARPPDVAGGAERAEEEKVQDVRHLVAARRRKNQEIFCAFEGKTGQGN